MKKSTLIRFGFILFFSLSLGSYLFLQQQSNQGADLKTETELEMEVKPELLESGASMLLQRAIGSTRNMLSN